MKHILLVCDHKWRDLPPLVSLKLLLESKRYRVSISSTQDFSQMIPILRPDCVILNHFFGAYYNQLAIKLRQANIAVMLLPTEGAGRPVFMEVDRGDVADLSLLDLIFNWSIKNTESMLKQGQVTADKIITAGCPRIDFYRDPLNAIIESKESFCSRYDLDPNKPIITWATQFTFAHVRKTDPDMWEKYVREMRDYGVKKCLDTLNIDVLDIPEYHFQLRQASCSAFFKLAQARDDIQFIIKRHPVEPASFYENCVAESGAKNVRLSGTEYIWDILNASDVLLHRHCTTAVEAWLLDKPTIEMAMVKEDFMAWPDREAGSFLAHNYEELDSLISDVINGFVPAPDLKTYRDNYIEQWLGKPDGLRTLQIANAIDQHMRTNGHHKFKPSTLKLGHSKRHTISAFVRNILSLPANSSIRKDALNAIFNRSDIQKHYHSSKLISRADVNKYVRILNPAVQQLLKSVRS